MVYKGTSLKVACNSGAISSELFGYFKKTGKSSFKVGDVVKVAIKSIIPHNKKVNKGDVFNAMIVRTRYCVRRKDGSYAQAGDNSVVLLTPDFKMVGSRVFGFVAREAIKNGLTSSICEGVY